VLDDSLRTAATGDFNLPAAAFKYKNGLVPGTVMVQKGEKVTVHTGSGVAGYKSFGLLANFVGGDLDDLGDENYVGVWRGPDSVYEILSPGFNDDALLTAWNASGQGTPVPLYVGVDGRLSTAAASAGSGGLGGTLGAAQEVIAYLIERPNQNRIVVDLKV